MNARETELPVREAAVETLAAIRTPDSVEALVNIALNDEDQEDRDAACEALATIPSEELQKEVLVRIRDTEVVSSRAEAESGGKAVLSRIGGVVAAIAAESRQPTGRVPDRSAGEEGEKASE